MQSLVKIGTELPPTVALRLAFSIPFAANSIYRHMQTALQVNAYMNCGGARRWGILRVVRRRPSWRVPMLPKRRLCWCLKPMVVAVTLWPHLSRCAAVLGNLSHACDQRSFVPLLRFRHCITSSAC